MRKKRTDGRTGIGKRILAGGLSLAAALCLASCGAENGAETTGAEGVQEKQQVRPGGEAARQEETQPAIVDGVQLAAGYGIFSAGQPQVYVMKKNQSRSRRTARKPGFCLPYIRTDFSGS